MIQFLVIITIYILSWGFLWISEIPQDIFGDQFLDDNKVIFALAIFAICTPVVAGGILVLTLLDEILPGGIDI